MRRLVIILPFIFIAFLTRSQTAEQFSTRSTTGFIENKGQIHDQNYQPNPAVKYLLTLNKGMNVQLKANSFSYDTYITERSKREKQEEEPEMLRHPFDSAERYDIIWHFHRVDVELVGANPNPEIIAEQPSEDYLNYYNGVTPEAGATFVRYYQKVTYKNIYPGIDLEFEARVGTEKPVEYNFIIHPGAVASQIRMKYNGANDVQLNEGCIQSVVNHGILIESIPHSYFLEVNRNVNVIFNKLSGNEFGFLVAEEIAQNTLVIDPTPRIVWSTYYGSDGHNTDDRFIDMVADKNDGIFILGVSDFPVTSLATSGVHQSTFAGYVDAIFAKFNSSGKRIWCTYYGGENHDIATSVSTDNYGNYLIAGSTESLNGISTNNSYQNNYFGKYDAFVARFNSQGHRMWGTYYGGKETDKISSICVCQENFFVIAGHTKSDSNIATTNAYQVKLNGEFDAFIAKFDLTGELIWSTYYGDKKDEVYPKIRCDQLGNIYLICSTESQSNVTTVGSYQEKYSGKEDILLVKLDELGNRIWGTYYGGPDFERSIDVVSDLLGNIYILGITSSLTGISTPGSFQQNFKGTKLFGDLFIVKFDSFCNRLWGTYYGGSSGEFPSKMIVDSDNNLIIIGATESNDFNVSPDALQISKSGSQDGFILKMDDQGNRIWSTYFGGIGSESCNGIALDQNGNFYITGSTNSTSGISTPNAYQKVFAGLMDGFITKFVECKWVFDTIFVSTCDSYYFNGLMYYKSGIYYDTLINYIGCDSLLVLYLIVKSSPKADFKIIDSIQCLKENYFYFINSSLVDTSKNVTYYWDFGDNNFSTQKNPIHHYSAWGNYRVKLLVIYNGIYKDSTFKDVIIYPSPSVSFAINDPEQCLDGNQFIFTNTSTIPDGKLTFLWDFGDKSFPDTIIHTSKTYAKWQKYIVQLIAKSDKNCTDTFKQDIMIFPVPVTEFVFRNNCLNDTVWFYDKSITDSGKIIKWLWDFNNGNKSFLQNTWQIYRDSGQKSVTLISTNDFSCSSDTTHYFYNLAHVTEPVLERSTIENNERVLVEWLPPRLGNPMTYHLERSTDGTNWQPLKDENRNTFSYLDPQARFSERPYYYRLNATDSCDYTGDYSNIGKTIHLTADTNDLFPLLTWTPYELWVEGVLGYALQVKGWGDFQTLIEIPNSAIPNPQSAISQTDSFFTVTDKDYCYRVIAYRSGDSLQSVSNEVCIPNAFRLFIPNAFSPNHDGINDVFMPVGIFIKDYNLQIYNRWGEKIFESSDINKGWNGVFKGEDCPLGVYYYQIRLTGANGKKTTKSGTVTLLK